MKKALVILGLVTGLFAVGCGDSTSPGSTGAAAGTGTGAAVALADSDVPVQADFEEEAEKAISQANYKSELDNLEKEIDTGK